MFYAEQITQKRRASAETCEQSPMFHFSIDDVLKCFDLRKSGEKDFLRLLDLADTLHADFRCGTDLYLFNECSSEAGIFNLASVSSEVVSELSRRPWIKLGPHAKSKDHLPYLSDAETNESIFEETFAFIDTVSPAARSAFSRLHFFSECQNLESFFRLHGITYRYLTDKPAISYHFPPDQKDMLLRSGELASQGLLYLRSIHRLEDTALSVPDLAAHLLNTYEQYGYLSVFTHEYEILPDRKLFDRTLALFTELKQRGVDLGSREKAVSP
ncbi:MAG: hypothetical protein AAGA15_02290 [Pseudomonadota bacterium]